MADDDRFFSKYNDLISEAIDQYHVPGISVAVVHGLSTFTKAYGYARLPNEKATTDTLFNAASMTKAFVAASLSLLVDDDAFPDVKWSTPVSKLIPDDFALCDSRYTDTVTLEDILSHRSGLPDQDDACFGVSAAVPDTPKSCTRKLRHLPLSTPLRSKFQYCNLMYVVAVHIVETLTGMPMVEFLRRRLWEPLGMKNTYFGNDDVIKHGAIDLFAKGYGWDKDESANFNMEWPVQPEAAGAGEMISTAGDYAKFLRCMIYKTEPISQASHKELVSPRTLATDDEPKPYWSHMLYALGWLVETYHGERILSHGGGTTGFECQMWFIPRLEWGVVIFGNLSGGSAAIDKICGTMIDDAIGVPEEKRADWDKLAEEDREEPETTLEDLYPAIADPPVPLALPLYSYAGSYWNPGYGTFVVEYKDGGLKIDAHDRTYPFTLSLRHVSGEFFVAEKLDSVSRDKLLMKAVFRVDVQGASSEFGASLVDELNGEMIWFKRSGGTTSDNK